MTYDLQPLTLALLLSGALVVVIIFEIRMIARMAAREPRSRAGHGG